MRTLLLALLLASACETSVTSRFIQLNEPTHPLAHKTPDKVQVFTSGHPEIPYTEIGVLEEQVVWYGDGDSLALVLAHLRADGAGLGCDAVVLGGSAEETKIKSSYGQGGFWGTCIVYNR